MREPYTNLTAADVRRITGSNYYRGGMHTPGTVLVQPAALVRGLARTMPDNVQVYENSPVTQVSPGQTIRLQSPRGILATPGLILANSGYASQCKPLRGRHERSLRARSRFPNLPDVDYEYTWGGALSLSRNSVPYFGRVMPGIFAAVCQNGLGVAGGTITGKLLAEYVCGHDSEPLRHLLSKPLPVGNVPRPLLDLGVRGSILWKEWCSGAEI